MGDEPGYFCSCIGAMAVSRAEFDAQSLELQDLKAQRRNWFDNDITARALVSQEQELQAVREALGTLRDYAFKAAVLNDSDHIRGNSIKAHKMLMALAGMSPGYDHKIDAALKQSRGAT